ncbi:hypothetical protein M409DRAFT_66650 [Zasmidium cellare ATCC 36951]|uniref:Peptidase S53 domain-containing protein n=1 Tax=Zasmidium cellare ATCC 36951 TaxID=1080233 RepID=A0A6A6CKJ6_ZASCE|nr:uncharacterized protein M409DRAFT_66650 [Zasmidium cellare ATCC 36951]KAF2166680.1 hypothetical protein M409DRAFT_66650 [Zasmidium cellare ATCC 36951]
MHLQALVLLVFAVASSSQHRVVHERNQLTPQHHWFEHSIQDTSRVVRATIGLKQRNLDHAYDYVLDVSHPDSANYGKFWSRQGVEEIFSPSSESTDVVMDWLNQTGIHMFGTTYHQYQNVKTGASSYACAHYSLPAEVALHVDYVRPGVTPMLNSQRAKNVQGIQRRDAPVPFHQGPAKGPIIPYPPHIPPPAKQLPPELQYCGYNITPPCLRALYNLPVPLKTLGDGELGVQENGAYSQEDLDDFFAKYAPSVPNSTHPHLVSINGGTAPTTTDMADGEADLDFQVAYGLLGPSNITLYQVQDPVNYHNITPLMTDLLDAIDGSFCDEDQRQGGFMCGGDSLTNVLSVSMEDPELFMQCSVYQQRACNEFMKLGLQGKTTIFSSGDYGVAASPRFGEPLCLNNGCAPQDLQNHPLQDQINNGTIFMPGFPSNCPYVLSVGGTMLESNQTVRDPETAMNLPNVGACPTYPAVRFSSSGGFANFFDRPSYQDQAITNYYSKFGPSYPSYDSNKLDVTDNATNIGKNGGIYNRIGRGTPDVSANGANFMSFNQGQDKPTDGTSVAAPIWGSIVAIINEKRAQAGKGPVGFINPVLYAHPEALHDITSGNNPGCGTAGFEAVEGWDPVTGLGTPNFPALERLFLSLP